MLQFVECTTVLAEAEVLITKSICKKVVESA